jgi:hypothetical protein
MQWSPTSGQAGVSRTSMPPATRSGSWSEDSGFLGTEKGEDAQGKGSPAEVGKKREATATDGPRDESVDPVKKEGKRWRG